MLNVANRKDGDRFSAKRSPGQAGQDCDGIEKVLPGWGVTCVEVSQISHGGILNGKSVLVTGGSRGIGLAIAKKCPPFGIRPMACTRYLLKLQ